MKDEQTSTLLIIIFIIAAALLVWGINSSVTVREASTNPPISTSASSLLKAGTTAPNEEAQRKARKQTMNLVISNLGRKFDQIDNRLRTRLSLDAVEIKGRRVLQGTNLERECQNAMLEYARRSTVQPLELAPIIINEPEPEYLAERRPGDQQIEEADMPTVSSRQEALYIPNGLDSPTTHSDFWSLEQGEGEGNGLRWRDPNPLVERIRDWQGNVQHGTPSDVHSAPRLNTLRRRVLW